MSFTIEIDGDQRIVQKLGSLNTLVKDPQQQLTETGDLLIQEFEDNFPVEGKRLESPWQELTAETIAQKIRMGYGSKGILERTGALKKAFTKSVSKLKVTVTNTATYYKYHQLGTKYIPERTIIKSTERIKQDIIEIFNKAIQEKLK
jgi:phage gpG-like protein